MVQLDLYKQADTLAGGGHLEGHRELFASAPEASAAGGTASEIKVVEVEAFASVHDMIHAAIASYGSQATLREIYRACEERGRIAYKRSGGSRLITQNDHWKSQIRHALYTCDRFVRAANDADSWTVSAAFALVQPATTKVLIRTDSSDAASISDEAMEGRNAGRTRRHTRAKLGADATLPAASPRKKRSRLGMDGQQAQPQLFVADGAAELPSDSPRAPRPGFKRPSLLAASRSPLDEAGPGQAGYYMHPHAHYEGPEGEDESSHTDLLQNHSPKALLAPYNRVIVAIPTQ